MWKATILSLGLRGQVTKRNCMTCLMAQRVKNLLAMQETRVQSLGQEDPLKKEWLPILVFLPGKFHGQRSLAGYSPWGHKESDSTEQLTPSLSVIPVVVGKSQLGRSQGSSRTQLLPVCSTVGWDLEPINTLIFLSCSQISSWGLPLVKTVQ